MKHFSDYQKQQFERGKAFAKENWKQDGLKPNDADADSTAFMRGYIMKKHDIDFGPRGDDLRGETDNALSVLGLEADYYWDLRMLDKELFHAILTLMEKLADEEPVE